jgi:hypothetical protein
VGLNVKEVSLGERTVRVAVAELEPIVPLMVAFVLAFTAVVETVKVAVLEPLGTLTEALTFAAALEELSETVLPPDPASADKVTVPVKVAPPATLVSDKAMLFTVWAVARPQRITENSKTSIDLEPETCNFPFTRLQDLRDKNMLHESQAVLAAHRVKNRRLRLLALQV